MVSQTVFFFNPTTSSIHSRTRPLLRYAVVQLSCARMPIVHTQITNLRALQHLHTTQRIAKLGCHHHRMCGSSVQTVASLSLAQKSISRATMRATLRFVMC